MTLYEAQKGGSYCIEGLYVEPAITRRLQALGLNDGTVINVLNRKKKGALIIQVRGTRLALGKHISSSIEISDAADGTDTSHVSAFGKAKAGDSIAPKAEQSSKDGIAPKEERASGDGIEPKAERSSEDGTFQQKGQEAGAKGEGRLQNSDTSYK